MKVGRLTCSSARVSASPCSGGAVAEIWLVAVGAVAGGSGPEATRTRGATGRLTSARSGATAGAVPGGRTSKVGVTAEASNWLVAQDDSSAADAQASPVRRSRGDTDMCLLLVEEAIDGGLGSCRLRGGFGRRGRGGRLDFGLSTVR